MVPSVADPDVLLIEDQPLRRRYGIGCRRGHVRCGDEVRLAELLGGRLVGDDGKIEKHRAVIGMVADGQQIAFRGQGVGKRQGGVGRQRVAFVLQTRSEGGLSQDCGGGSAGRGGDAVKFQDALIAAVRDKERVAMTQNFIGTVQFARRAPRGTGDHVGLTDHVGSYGIGGSGNRVEHQDAMIALFDHE